MIMHEWINPHRHAFRVFMHQQLAAVVGVVRQRKAHFGAAGNGAEGVFIMFVSRIEIGSHVCLLSL